MMKFLTRQKTVFAAKTPSAPSKSKSTRFFFTFPPSETQQSKRSLTFSWRSWRSWRLGGSIAVLLTLPFVQAWAAPSQSTFTYNIAQGKEIIGEVQETLSIDAQRYQLESKTVPQGVTAVFVKDTITMKSEGGYNAQGLRPERFEFHRSAKSKKDATARFDWAAKTAEFSYEGKTESQALPEQLQDRLSALYQFRFLSKPAKTLTLPVSNGKKIENQLFKYQGEETLTLPIGKLKALRFVRERTPDDDGIAIWISEQYAAPVKIVVTSKKGNQTEQVLKRVKLDGR